MKVTGRSTSRRRLGGRAALTLLAALALLLALGCATASPEGRIVVHGARSGSHLRLAARSGHIMVWGHMARSEPTGCRFLSGHRFAVCGLAGIDSIEVDMGPADDKVEVLNRLPVPLTAYEGRGSDQMIGKGERDICYPEGTQRNRCVGGGGNDICISGPRNTDCVGGRGNDYCRMSTGSDGCWGGPGRDVCRMGPGQDGCHGGPGNDRLFGGPGADQLYGGPGFDYCDGGPGIGRSHGCEAGPRH